MYHRALKLIRQYHRLAQVELADALGLSKSFISELERENGKTPSIDVLKRYADYFRLPLSSLVLFAERSQDAEFSENSRALVAGKVLKMLEWLHDTTSDDESTEDAQ